jgi:type II pantothenate kinase
MGNNECDRLDVAIPLTKDFPRYATWFSTLVGFLAGVGTAVIVQNLYNTVSPASDQHDALTKTTQGERSRSVETSSNGKESSMDHLKWRSSFYELTATTATELMRKLRSSVDAAPQPTRRAVWPWQQRRRGRSNSPDRETLLSQGDDCHDRVAASESSSIHLQSETSLCIGCIFGMDVGGTLAKLVYFESDDSIHNYYANASQNQRRSSAFMSSPSKSFHPHHYLGPPSTISRRRQTIHDGLLLRYQESTDMEQKLDGASSSLHELGTVIHDSHARPENTLPNSDPKVSVNVTGRMFVPISEELISSDDIHDDGVTRPKFGSNNANLLRRDNIFSKAIDDASMQSDEIDCASEFVCTRRRSLSDQLHLMAEKLQYADDLTEKSKKGELHNKLCSIRPLPASSTKNWQTQTTRANKGSPINRCRSMLQVARSRDHAEALDRFYHFARKLDSHMQEGVRDKELLFHSRELGGHFHFIRFQTRHMNRAMDLIRANNLHHDIKQVGVTGGGAHKFAESFRQQLGIEFEKQHELDSLVAGMQFVLSTVVGECYTFRPENCRVQPQPNSSPTEARNDESAFESVDYISGFHIDTSEVHVATAEIQKEKKDQASNDRGQGDEWWWSRKVQRDSISYSSTYPYLLVTIGTGVSILRVDGSRKHERISGSTIGGGTYFGLIRLLTDCEDFDDVMQLAERGDPSKVDMMVGDIYGRNSDALEKIGLPSNLVASSFGKLVAKEDPAADLKEEDLARALLLMVTNNIGQVAFLNAKLYGTKRIYFVGNFLRQNKLSQRRLSYAIDYWSKGEMEALFLEHEGYFGALGAFLITQGISHDTQSVSKQSNTSNNTNQN